MNNDSALLQGLPPVANDSARLLILGSMPGLASLRAGQYYAHPRNAFWPIMGDLVGASPTLPYDARLARLQAAGIALWDVIGACVRPGSLDADIVTDSIRANDFIRFFDRYRTIRRICFNGTAAEAAFRRHVAPTLPAQPARHLRLPSTSPAHAALAYEQKLAAWSAILAE